MFAYVRVRTGAVADLALTHRQSRPWPRKRVHVWLLVVIFCFFGGLPLAGVFKSADCSVPLSQRGSPGVPTGVVDHSIPGRERLAQPRCEAILLCFGRPDGKK